jgi:hypothetical protein
MVPARYRLVSCRSRAAAVAPASSSTVQLTCTTTPLMAVPVLRITRSRMASASREVTTWPGMLGPERGLAPVQDAPSVPAALPTPTR